MNSIFEGLEKTFNTAKKTMGNIVDQNSMSTVIVQAQVFKNAKEAEEANKDWKIKEQKQLMDNFLKALK